MFYVGDRVRLTAIGEEQYSGQAKGSTGTITRVGKGEESWHDVKWDNGHSNNYQSKDLFVTVRATPEEVVQEAPAAPAKPRVKYLYSVQDESGYPILNTRDREYAREFKTQMGGKKEGVVIIAYAPVKEIR